MHFDIWEKERISAEVLPNGLRPPREDRAGELVTEPHYRSSYA